MVKKRLMLGAAFAALSLIPLTTNVALADGNEGDLLDNYDLDIKADWDNDVDIELDWDVDVSKELSIHGHISIDGSVTADALSHATLDDKQMLSENEVQFEDYQNAYQNEPSQNQDNEPGVGQGTSSPLYTEEGAASGPATYSNTIVSTAVASSTSGNVGINLAAGDYNLQENAAVISSADGSFPAGTEAGSTAYASASAASDSFSGPSSGSASSSSSWASSRSARTSGAAEAGSFSLQSLYNNGFNDESYELENTKVDTSVSVTGALSTADGNLGLNAASGAFNIQKNALVIASVTGGHLAEATSGVLQHSEKNDSVVEDVSNTVNFASSLTGASGNIGVNLAAGVGNLQLNTLTIANALGGAPAVDTGTGPGATNSGGGG